MINFYVKCPGDACARQRGRSRGGWTLNMTVAQNTWTTTALAESRVFRRPKPTIWMMRSLRAAMSSPFLCVGTLCNVLECFHHHQWFSFWTMFAASLKIFKLRSFSMAGQSTSMTHVTDDSYSSALASFIGQEPLSPADRQDDKVSQRRMTKQRTKR